MPTLDTDFMLRQPVKHRQVRDYVTLEQLRDDYEFLGCDHSSACCSTHGTHTQPHMGCLFR